MYIRRCVLQIGKSHSHSPDIRLRATSFLGSAYTSSQLSEEAGNHAADRE